MPLMTPSPPRDTPLEHLAGSGERVTFHSREHVQGRGRCGVVKGGLHRFAIKGDQRPLREVRNGTGPGQEVCLKALRIEASKDATKGVVGGNAVGQGEERVQSGALALAEEFHILEAFPARQERAQGND